MTKAYFKTAVPYASDKMNLHVENVEQAIPYYETVMGFNVASQATSPHKSVTLSRDDVQIGLAENGGDPSQEGCFFEVDNVEKAFAELQANGLGQQEAKFSTEKYGSGSTYRVFFV